VEGGTAYLTFEGGSDREGKKNEIWGKEKKREGTDSLVGGEKGKGPSTSPVWMEG